MRLQSNKSAWRVISAFDGDPINGLTRGLETAMSADCQADIDYFTFQRGKVVRLQPMGFRQTGEDATLALGV